MRWRSRPVTSSVGGSIIASMSANGMRFRNAAVLLVSNAAQPPSRLCMPSVQLSPAAMARLPAAVCAIGSASSTVRMTAESSTSGYQSLANSNAQPPGSSVGFSTDQSPGRKIWFATSQSPARPSAGWEGSSPASRSALAASAVSQFGDTHGWYMSVPSHSTRKSSTPWIPLIMTG